MKRKLRKELRALRRALPATDHALRSNLAASRITRMAAFKSGARVAIYLPFDREDEHGRSADRGAAAADSDFRSGGERPAASAPALSSSGGEDPARGVRHLGASPQPARARGALVRSHRRAAGRSRPEGPPPGDGPRILRPRARLSRASAPLDGTAAGRPRPSNASAPSPCYAQPWDVRLDALATELGLEYFSEGHAMNHWLLKSEPDTFSIDHLAALPRQTTAWDGVRNYQARNMLRDSMKKGDTAFFYHSSCEHPGHRGHRARREGGVSGRAPPSTRSIITTTPTVGAVSLAGSSWTSSWCASSSGSSRSMSCASMRAMRCRTWSCCGEEIACR